MQIYKITNLITGKFYIGKDEKDRANYFGSGKIIKLAIKKYGLENFKKEVLETCNNKKSLCEREKFWIKNLNSQVNGYNIASGGTGGDTLTNHPNRMQIIEKRKLSNTGKKRSPEFCQLMRDINFRIDKSRRLLSGKKAAKTKSERWQTDGYTEKERNGRSIATKKLIEYSKSEIGRKTISDRLKGKSKKPFTEEHKCNIGKASKNRPGPNKKRIQIDEIIYESLHDASNQLMLAVTTIRYRLLSSKFSNWKYLEH
jgi:group I intron endonuclease